jgi:hypothetical protein
VKNSTRLKKMHTRAKQIIKAHPNMQYRTAQAQAGKEMSSGKLSGRKKSKRAAPRPKKRAARRVGSHKPKYKCIHEVRKVGSMAEVRDYKRQGRKILESQLAWLLLQIDQEQKVSVKRNLLKKKAELKREIKALS